MIIHDSYLAAIILYLGTELEVVACVLSFKMRMEHVEVTDIMLYFLRDTEDHNVDYYQ
jgi:hypothetical protein